MTQPLLFDLDTPSPPDPAPSVDTRPDVRALLERRVEQYPLVNLGKRPVFERRYTDIVTGDVAVIRTSSPRGLPSPWGQDVYMGLCYLLNVAMGGDGRTVPPDRAVETDFATLFDLLRKTRGGVQDQLLRDALDDWHGIGLSWAAAPRRAGRRGPGVLANVIDNVYFGADDGPTTRVKVLFNVEFLRSISEGRRLRYIVLDEYLRYQRPTTRRLFRFLDLLRYRGKAVDEAPAETITLSLADLQNSLPLSTDKTLHILRNLRDVHEELAISGFLRDLPEIDTRGRGTGSTFVVYRPSVPTDDDRAVRLVPTVEPVVRQSDKSSDSGADARWRRLMLASSGDEQSDPFFRKCAIHLTDEHVNTVVSDIEADLRGDSPLPLDVRRKTLVRRLRDRLTQNGVR
jgi:hypothetical protein